MAGSGRGSWPVVTTDGTGIVSHAGTALLQELAERTGLRGEYAAVVEGLRRRAGGHDPGQVLVDLAVMLADGGEAIADIAALTDQPALRGPAASAATAWRVLAGVDEARLGLLRAARAAARDLDYVVLDLDAARVERIARDHPRQAPRWAVIARATSLPHPVG